MKFNENLKAISIYILFGFVLGLILMGAVWFGLSRHSSGALDRAENHIHELEGTISQLTQRTEDLTGQIDHLQEQNARDIERIRELNDNFEQLTKQLGEYQSAIERYKEQIAASERAAREYRERIEVLEGSLVEVRGYFDSYERTIDNLLNGNADLSGEVQSALRILSRLTDSIREFIDDDPGLTTDSN
jgi:chromosome segregation ATPase